MDAARLLRFRRRRTRPSPARSRRRCEVRELAPDPRAPAEIVAARPLRAQSECADQRHAKRCNRHNAGIPRPEKTSLRARLAKLRSWSHSASAVRSCEAPSRPAPALRESRHPGAEAFGPSSWTRAPAARAPLPSWQIRRRGLVGVRRSLGANGRRLRTSSERFQRAIKSPLASLSSGSIFLACSSGATAAAACFPIILAMAILIR